MFRLLPARDYAQDEMLTRLGTCGRLPVLSYTFPEVWNFREGIRHLRLLHSVITFNLLLDPQECSFYNYDYLGLY